MDIGKRIISLREQRGWTTNKLANTSGVSQSFLRAVELGQKGISVESLSAVCWALGVSLETFFAQCPEDGSVEAQLLFKVRQLSPAQQQTLLDFLNSIS